MQLQDFFDYKNRFMEDILTNENIVSLLTDGNVTVENAHTLVYKQVFPFEYIPETIQDGYTFICCDVDIDKSLAKPFYLPTLYVWVFSHRSRLCLPEGGVRTDKICSEICKAINGSMMYGLGELEFYSAKRFAPVTDYNGKVLVFHAKEFNKVSDRTKMIPSNRKAM